MSINIKYYKNIIFSLLCVFIFFAFFIVGTGFVFASCSSSTYSGCSSNYLNSCECWDIAWNNQSHCIEWVNTGTCTTEFGTSGYSFDATESWCSFGEYSCAGGGGGGSTACSSSCPSYCLGGGTVPGANGTSGCNLTSTSCSGGQMTLNWSCGPPDGSWGCAPYGGIDVYVDGDSTQHTFPGGSTSATLSLDCSVNHTFILEPDCEHYLQSACIAGMSYTALLPTPTPTPTPTNTPTPTPTPTNTPTPYNGPIN